MRFVVGLGGGTVTDDLKCVLELPFRKADEEMTRKWSGLWVDIHNKEYYRIHGCVTIAGLPALRLEVMPPPKGGYCLSGIILKAMSLRSRVGEGSEIRAVLLVESEVRGGDPSVIRLSRLMVSTRTDVPLGM
jgi:hypothetical protein